MKKCFEKNESFLKKTTSLFWTKRALKKIKRFILKQSFLKTTKSFLLNSKFNVLNHFFSKKLNQRIHSNANNIMDTTNHKKTKLQEKIFINTLKSRMNSIGPGSPLNIGQYNQDVMQNVIDRMQFKKDNFQLNKESVNFSRKWSTKELAKYYTSGFVPEF